MLRTDFLSVTPAAAAAVAGDDDIVRAYNNVNVCTSVRVYEYGWNCKCVFVCEVDRERNENEFCTVLLLLFS